MEEYTNQVLRVVVAQVCQAIGWHTIQSTPLELLIDILQKYMQELSVRTFRYTQHYSRTEANLDDVGLAFQDLGIVIPDLLEYINNVDSVPCAVEVPQYPVPKESSLNFLKPGSKEVITRPVYVHEYLPPIHPDKEDDASAVSELGVTALKTATIVSDPSTVITDITNTTVNNANINNNRSVFKKPDICDLATSYKKSRFLHEDEGRPTREISSVMMTSSGFISPAREGKLPDSKTPVIPDFKPLRPPTPPHTAIAATPPLVANPSNSTPTPTAAKADKKSKKQKNTRASPAEAKEQRRRERHLAKMQKRQNETGPMKPPSKRPKIRESKAKKHPVTAVSTTQSLTSSLFHTLTPVSLPSDLTIKSETVPVTSLCSGNNISINSSNATHSPGGIDKKSCVISDEIKLNSELDKQKYSIFKKISAKKSREDAQKGLSVCNLSQSDLYSGFPTLPESTTIRRVPTVKFDSPPRTDPNIIVVDDDSPPRHSSSPVPGTSGSQLLSMSSMPVCSSATPGFQPPFFDSAFMHMRQTNPLAEPTKKQQRKPRKNKQQAPIEQSAPLNLSNESSTGKSQHSIGNNPPVTPAKTPRKRQNKVGRPSKRAAAKINLPSGPAFPGVGLPPMGPESNKRDDMSPMNMFKANSNQFLSGMHRFPLLNAFHLLAGPGLIPNPNFMHPSSNPLLPFRNPFGYNEFMGLRPPIRPPKIDEVPPASPPSSLPLDLESNVYCNVPPLVPDSLKLQLSPALSSRGNKPGSSTASSTIGSSYSTLKNSNTKMASPNLSIFQSSTVTNAANKSPKLLDAPIEISDDDKSMTKSDTEGENPPPDSTSRGNSGNETVASALPAELITSIQDHASAKSSNSQRLIEPKTAVEANEDAGSTYAPMNKGVDLANANSNMSDDTPPLAGASSSFKGDKKREKEHKKGKRGKDGKIKKKKDKKDKTKNKEKTEKRKEEKKEKDRTKKKKEKRKDKGRQQPFAEVDDTKPTSTTNEPLVLHDPGVVSSSSGSIVPKLTLKFGSPQSVASDDLQEIKKKSTKSNGVEEIPNTVGTDGRRESSPELARISPLVTRPPKQKASTKEKSSDSEQTSSANFNSSSVNAPSSNPPAATRGPGRPSKSAANASAASSALQGQTSTVPGTSGGSAQPTATSAGTDGASTSGAELKTSADLLTHERGANAAAVNATSSGSNIGLRSSAKVTGASNATGSAAKQSNTEPIDAEGNQVWICPACGRVDDGTPMIGCDGCDAWYHWVCVGIQVPPDEREDWYCRNCIIKKQEANYHDKKKKRKKKNKAV